MKKECGFTLSELLVSITVIGVLTMVLAPALISTRQAATNNTAQTLARNVVTMAEAQRAESGGGIVYASATSCAPMLLAHLPSEVRSCEVKQDENTSYVLVKSAGGYYFRFDGEGLLGPLASAPASW